MKTGFARMDELAPIALFVYNRLNHTKKTVEALLSNNLAKNSTIYIFSDGAKDVGGEQAVQEVRDYLKSVSGFAKVNIIERNENRGLAASIVDGVSILCEQHGRVIVLEDDLITSPYFLIYMNDGLNFYSEDETVGSITGFSYPIKYQSDSRSILLPFSSSWGWATWSREWSLFESDSKKIKKQLLATDKLSSFSKVGGCGFGKMLQDHIDGKNDSWFIRWNASLFLKGKSTVWPSSSLVSNFGIDGTGVHCSKWFFNPFEVDVELVKKIDFSKPPIDTQSVMKKIRIFFYKVKFLRIFNALIRLTTQLKGIRA